MKKYTLAMILFVSGCGQIVPQGYFQPHVYKSDKFLEESELAVIYGSCQTTSSEGQALGNVLVLSVDGDRAAAYKVYVLPGKRKLNVSYFFKSQTSQGYFGADDIELELERGHKYQLVAKFGSTEGDILSGYEKPVDLHLEDKGYSYTPPKNVYWDHDPSDPLVVKKASLSVTPFDCRDSIPSTQKLDIDPEYKEIFLRQGYDL
ncbi:hypothetical protein [Ketobacter sp.]|uniref:hypothetical protein n=1 Tax=Ketobacter sp. TaxID=2083498 RepID=UPI000F18D583|nr:hypothetical protein [Ketobacter sp.]RLU01789.1 MAG: hypothetical protein D9N14_01230 [Ketobacter sp.]